MTIRLYISVALATAIFASTATTRGQEVSGLAAAVAMEKVMVDAIARTERSVVAIGMFRRETADANALPSRFNLDDGDLAPDLEAIPDAFGSGVVIDRRGLILTAWHVLKERHKTMRLFVRVAGKPLWAEVRVKAADPFSDLAVLEVDQAQAGKTNWQPIPLGDASALKRGNIVIALGNPYAIARDGQASASWGIVSNLRRKAPPRTNKSPPESRPTMHHFGTLIQTDAKLNLGTSGGPLLNLKGEMVGLTTAMSALVGYEKSAGYAIAVDDTFRRVVETLKQGREVEYGFLGVSPRDLSHLERKHGRTGVRIDRVVVGTPAFGALQMGDIVTHIDGEPMQSTTDLMLSIGRRPSGSRVTLTVDRFERRVQVPIMLTKNRVLGERIITTQPPAWRGMRVEYPAALRSLSNPEPIPEDCVTVVGVEADSPAANAKLAEGMLVTHVENVRVASPPEFAIAVAQHNGAVRLQLRNGPDDLNMVTVALPAQP